jgi:hypothetical protein
VVLRLGIVFLPFLFAWLLLQRGYSQRARVLGLGWLALVLAVVATKEVNQASTAGTGPTDGPPPATAQAEFDKVNRHFVAVIEKCEQAAADVEPYLHTSDAYGGYDAAVTAKSACMNAWTDVDAARFGEPIPQPVQVKLNDDLSACSKAYLAKASAYDRVATVLNGDMKASTVRQTEYEIAASTQQVGDCVTGYARDARDAGLALPGDLLPHKGRHRKK